ncbi:MAG: ATP-binding protein [Novosphingobium sp.]|nr:ATP-binding protein [Novosphingobium sp.]
MTLPTGPDTSLPRRAAPAATHLRLIAPPGAAAPGSSEEPAHVTALALKGIRRGVATAVRPLAWHAFVDGLWPHESVDIVHQFGHSAPQQYRFAIRLRQTLASRAGQSAQALRIALGSAFPSWVLDDEGPAADDMGPLRATMVPLPLQLFDKDDPATTRRMPFPGSLPDWLLTTPFDEALAGGPWECRIRVRRAATGSAERVQYLNILRALQRGALQLRDPRAPEAPYLHDVELDAAAQQLLTRWLTRSGAVYTLAVELRAQQAMSDYALRRLQRDLFGDFPSAIVPPDDPVPGPQPLLPSQGLGGFFPDAQRAVKVGIEEWAQEPELPPEEAGACVGHTQAGRRVVMPERLRNSHTLVVGSSGSGKSTTLGQLQREAISAGAGLALIDPHGDLCDATLRAIPRSRMNDVVIVDLEDTRYVPALNPMEGTLGDARRRDFVAAQVVDLIDKLFENNHSTGPVTRSHIRYATQLAMFHPSGGTLRDVPRLFLDADFREYLLSKADENTRNYFAQFESTSGDHGFNNWRPYITARFEPIVSNPRMLALLCRPSTVDLLELMGRSAIVLFRLSKTVLSETECQVLGSLLLMQFHLAAMRGNALGRRPDKPFHLVIDEFHSFCSPSVPALFRESRKFGLALTVATQSIGSIAHPQAPDLANTVLTNTAAKCFFRLSPAEALRIDEYTAPEFPARELARLPNYHVVVSQAAAGIAPVLVRAQAPLPVADAADPDELRELSGQHNATPIDEAMAFLSRRHEIDPALLKQ